MRAIDADAFKDYIRGACEDMKHLFKDNADFAKLITESFCKDIDEQPTIQPAEPKRIRGKWSIKGQAIDTVRGYWATCSACGHAVFGGGNYCANCGSYNKGEVTT